MAGIEIATVAKYWYVLRLKPVLDLVFSNLNKITEHLLNRRLVESAWKTSQFQYFHSLENEYIYMFMYIYLFSISSLKILGKGRKQLKFVHSIPENQEWS